MTEQEASTHTILVDEEVYDLLSRTATTHQTDVNGALRYLLAVPPVPPVPASVPTDEDE